MHVLRNKEIRTLFFTTLMMVSLVGYFKRLLLYLSKQNFTHLKKRDKILGENYRLVPIYGISYKDDGYLK